MGGLNTYGIGDSISSSDYIGFTFNGVHSSELGIKRTSEGSRFNENLLPTIQDKAIQIPGRDGMYYFGSYYTQRQFNISYAFDSLTEQQLSRIKAVFGDKKPHRLIFDEAPYKVYLAKVTGSASIKHVPFAEGATNRVYKGEGSIQFTAYEPFARSVYKYLDQYIPVIRTLQPTTYVELSEEMVLAELTWNENNLPIPGEKYRITYNDLEIIAIAKKHLREKTDSYTIFFGNEDVFVEYIYPEKWVEFYGKKEDAGKIVSVKIEQIEEPYQNLPEWKDAANLLKNQGEYDKLAGNYIKLYNPGDKETDYICVLNFQNGVIPSGEIKILDGDTPIDSTLVLEEIKAKGEDVQIRINTKLNLIEGYKYRSVDGKYIKSSTLYNDCIISGGFTKIPQTFNQFDLNTKRDLKMSLSSSLGANFERIEYDYLYY